MLLILADGNVKLADNIVQVGSVVTVIVTEVKKDNLSVDLSLKTKVIICHQVCGTIHIMWLVTLMETYLILGFQVILS